MLKTKRFISLLAAVFLIAMSVSSVYAAPPSPLHIVVEEFPGGTSAPPEPFSASGLAVDAGLVCASGMVSDEEVSWNEPAGSYQMIWALKHFVCGDGSGTFDIKMVVRLDLVSLDTTARWRIVGGTGDYSGLKGQGSLIGISNNPAPGILDSYDGVVH
jgi:hypothetical protein